MTDEEIETARAFIGMRRGAEEGTLEDIAWREAYKNVTEDKPLNQTTIVSVVSMRRAYYEGFIAGFTYKFKGQVNETN